MTSRMSPHFPGSRFSGVGLIVNTRVAEPEAVAAETRADAGPPVSMRRVIVEDFLVPVVFLVAAVLISWRLFRTVRSSPRRDLRRSMQRAKEINERVRVEDIPHPVPEMEFARRERHVESPNPFEVKRRALEPRRRSGTAELEDEPTPRPITLDPRSREALQRLRVLEEHPDAKDPRTEYRRVDDYVRRFLFEFHGVKAFGLTSAAVLQALPQEITESVVDYAGEILRVCELAEFPRHRPSRNELRHLYRLAADMVTARSASTSPE